MQDNSIKNVFHNYISSDNVHNFNTEIVYKYLLTISNSLSQAKESNIQKINSLNSRIVDVAKNLKDVVEKNTKNASNLDASKIFASTDLAIKSAYYNLLLCCVEIANVLDKEGIEKIEKITKKFLLLGVLSALASLALLTYFIVDVALFVKENNLITNPDKISDFFNSDKTIGLLAGFGVGGVIAAASLSLYAYKTYNVDKLTEK